MEIKIWVEHPLTHCISIKFDGLNNNTLRLSANSGSSSQAVLIIVRANAYGSTEKSINLDEFTAQFYILYYNFWIYNSCTCYIFTIKHYFLSLLDIRSRVERKYIFICFPIEWNLTLNSQKGFKSEKQILIKVLQSCRAYVHLKAS